MCGGYTGAMSSRDPRPAQLIERLGLQPHPEGGWYREVHRSARQVQPADDRSARSALTTIYFLLGHGEHSRWHRVRSDEAWHFYEGEPLELFCAPPDTDRVERIVLGAAAASDGPVHVVPAGWWQAARPLGAYALTGCTVAPGFVFEDFSFLADDENALARVVRINRAFGNLA